MKLMTILVTGSNGLIGSEAVEYFDRQAHRVVGVDNNMRRYFFGPQGDTIWNLERLKRINRNFVHYDIDIRDREKIFDILKQYRFDLIIHCAAQPSHDKATEIPLIDFEVNALGTINLLEATRQYCADAIFAFMSTNKVYGEAPNEKPLVELPIRKTTTASTRHAVLTKPCTPSLARPKLPRTLWQRNTGATTG